MLHAQFHLANDVKHWRMSSAVKVLLWSTLCFLVAMYVTVQLAFIALVGSDIPGWMIGGCAGGIVTLGTLVMLPLGIRMNSIAGCVIWQWQVRRQSSLM